jgi:epoxide hydrolase 4
MEMTMLHHYADVNGIQLHYVTEGTGKLILFLHGFPEFWYAWKDQIAEFGRDYRAVAPDLRGYNLSSRPEEVEQYQIPVLLQDVRALIEHLGYDRCVLVGHDWGGALAWYFAMAHPEYLEKLVILNAPHPAIMRRELAQNEKQREASQYMVGFRNPEAEQQLAANNYATLQHTVLNSLIERGHMTEEDRAAYLEAWSQPGALTGALNYYRATQQFEHNGEAIQVPTLVIWGEQDQYLLTGQLDGLDGVVANLTVKRVPDASHWIIHEQPELVNRTIREFIEQ